jgi:hypothetical protein
MVVSERQRRSDHLYNHARYGHQIPANDLHQQQNDVTMIQSLFVGSHFSDGAFQFVRNGIEGKSERVRFIARRIARKTIGKIARH